MVVVLDVSVLDATELVEDVSVVELVSDASAMGGGGGGAEEDARSEARDVSLIDPEDEVSSAENNSSASVEVPPSEVM